MGMGGMHMPVEARLRAGRFAEFQGQAHAPVRPKLPDSRSAIGRRTAESARKSKLRAAVSGGFGTQGRIGPTRGASGLNAGPVDGQRGLVDPSLEVEERVTMSRLPICL